MQDIYNSPLGLIEITGEDRANFLQGQFSNDMQKLTDTQWEWTTLCNPKGRAIATFMTWQNIDAIYLLGCSDICQHTVQHLQKFIFRSKVKLAVKQPFAYWDITENSNSRAITATDDSNIYAILAINGNQNWKLCLAPDTSLNERELTSEKFEKNCVEAALPFIGQTLSEELIPNHMDFTILEGLNFKKGCYTGQEVIARLHYLGKLKQALYQITSSTPINSGDKLYSPEKRKDQPVGDVLFAYKDNTSNTYTALACMKIDNSEDALAARTVENQLNDLQVKRCFEE